MKYNAGKFDIAVIGAGHAGCEAALATSRMGMKTLLFSISLEAVANMPCNPHIGGSSKGHLVREIDALGGEMGKNIDKTFTQLKMLNKSKGPAVYSLRAQADRKRYQMEMKHTLEKQENLYLKQAEIVDIEVRNGKVKSVTTNIGAVYEVDAIILATGTYLKGKIFIGDSSFDSGPDGVFPSVRLSDKLKSLGINLIRFKTGTPARIDKNSIDFSKMEIQNGDEEIEAFSFEDSIDKDIKQLPCYLTYTNSKTHEIIRENLHRSPLYAGKIEGTGPRYCPSIEDKVVRFSDKERHQVFIEPMGVDTDEMYVQGMSSSLPAHVQLQFMQTIPGLENCRMMRAGYAIDYDCLDPLQLQRTLEHKAISGLFSAGQANGTSGYEEAAAQGLLAGVNAMQKIRSKEPLILSRSEGYLGVLIDDLVTKGTNEPYRMMTSRAEYRLLLRQDNADLRLTEKGRAVGLVNDVRYEAFTAKRSLLERTLQNLSSTHLPPNAEVLAKLAELGTAPIRSGMSLLDLLRRSEMTYEKLQQAFEVPELPEVVAEQVEIFAKYEGYINKQKQEVEKALKLENKKIPADIDYLSIKELSSEAAEKLAKVKPASIGQASRISGVSPADVSVLMIALEVMRRKEYES